MSGKKVARETNVAVLRQAMLRRLPRRTAASGQVIWPAMPSLLDHYVRALGAIFASLGRTFSAAELDLVRENMQKHIEPAFKASPHSTVVVDYHTQAPPSTALTYTISHRVITMEDKYEEWVKERKPPLFGAHPDAKVMQLAQSLGEAGEVTVLDIGAGTGRNTLPLARAGFSADAVELAPALAAILREEVAKAGVSVRVFEGDALDPALEIPLRHYRLIVLAEVVASHFRTTAQIRTLLEHSAEWLAPGGVLLFSAFLSSAGYKPDATAREMSELMWCCVFTRRELEEAVEGLPLARVSDESAFEFEHEHLEPSAWPPTGWYAEWAQGQDLWDVSAEKSPLELRWLVYRRT
jgi:SAM-dependent methyltransferase